MIKANHQNQLTPQLAGLVHLVNLAGLSKHISTYAVINYAWPDICSYWYLFMRHHYKTYYRYTCIIVNTHCLKYQPLYYINIKSCRFYFSTRMYPPHTPPPHTHTNIWLVITTTIIFTFVGDRCTHVQAHCNRVKPNCPSITSKTIFVDIWIDPKIPFCNITLRFIWIP